VPPFERKLLLLHEFRRKRDIGTHARVEESQQIFPRADAIGQHVAFLTATGRQASLGCGYSLPWTYIAQKGRNEVCA